MSERHKFGGTDKQYKEYLEMMERRRARKRKERKDRGRDDEVTEWTRTNKEGETDGLTWAIFTRKFQGKKQYRAKFDDGEWITPPYKTNKDWDKRIEKKSGSVFVKKEIMEELTEPKEITEEILHERPDYMEAKLWGFPYHQEWTEYRTHTQPPQYDQEDIEQWWTETTTGAREQRLEESANRRVDAYIRFYNESEDKSVMLKAIWEQHSNLRPELRSKVWSKLPKWMQQVLLSWAERENRIPTSEMHYEDYPRYTYDDPISQFYLDLPGTTPPDITLEARESEPLTSFQKRILEQYEDDLDMWENQVANVKRSMQLILEELQKARSFNAELPHGAKLRYDNLKRDLERLYDNPPQKGEAYDPIKFIDDSPYREPDDPMTISDFQRWFQQEYGEALTSIEDITEARELYGDEYQHSKWAGEDALERFSEGVTTMYDLLDDMGAIRAVMYSALSPESYGGLIPDKYLGTTIPEQRAQYTRLQSIKYAGLLEEAPGWEDSYDPQIIQDYLDSDLYRGGYGEPIIPTYPQDADIYYGFRAQPGYQFEAEPFDYLGRYPGYRAPEEYTYQQERYTPHWGMTWGARTLGMGTVSRARTRLPTRETGTPHYYQRMSPAKRKFVTLQDHLQRSGYLKSPWKIHLDRKLPYEQYYWRMANSLEAWAIQNGYIRERWRY